MKNNFKIHRVVLKILLWIVVICFVGFLIFVGLQISGKNRLYKKSANKTPDLHVAEIDWGEESSESGNEESGEATTSQPILVTQEDTDNWEEGDVRFKGVHYRYNSEMLTFLFMGIDQDGTVKKAKSGIDGGQSDAIFLLALNPKTHEVSIINVNRNTMADVDVYDKAGNYSTTSHIQITLQHAYGDGKELSCERSVNAISKLFYNLPIHGYCAIGIGSWFAVQSIINMGVVSGLFPTKNGDVNRRKLEAYLDNAAVEESPVTARTAELYAKVYQALRKNGRLIPQNDMWIAASALEHGADIVTKDEHFKAVPMLTVITL